MSKSLQIDCHECTLRVEISGLQFGQKAICPRCGFVISRKHKNALQRMKVCSLTSALSLFFVLFFPLIHLNAHGLLHSMTLMESIQTLLSMGEWLLGLTVLTVVVIIPLIIIVALNSLTFLLDTQYVSPRTFILLRLIEFFRFWNMAEIYLLAVLISLIKVASIAELSAGFAAIFYILFNLTFIAAISQFDSVQIAQLIKNKVLAEKLLVEGVKSDSAQSLF